MTLTVSWDHGDDEKAVAVSVKWDEEKQKVAWELECK